MKKKKVKRIWVFGAGASAAEIAKKIDKGKWPKNKKCPVDSNFFEVFPAYFRKNKKNRKFFKELKVFLSQVYGYDLWSNNKSNKSKSPGLEEVFTKLEASLRWMIDLKEEQNTEKHRIFLPLIHEDCVENFYLPIFHYRDSFGLTDAENFCAEMYEIFEKAYMVLKYAMAKIFYEVSKDWKNKYPLHRKFVKLLNDPKSNDVIITTNYELILDKVLTAKKKLSKKPSRGYFQIFWNEYRKYQNYQDQNYQDERQKELYRKKEWEKDKTKILLLKLHGSINWKHDVTGTSKDANHFMRLDNEDELRETCLNFRSAQSLAFTPLVIDKQATFRPTSKFGRVWAKAFEELKEADEIYFIGCSLPPTDFMAKDLFKSAHNQRKVNKKLKIYFCTEAEKEDYDQFKNDEKCEFEKKCKICKATRKTEEEIEKIYKGCNIEYLGNFEEIVNN